MICLYDIRDIAALYLAVDIVVLALMGIPPRDLIAVVVSVITFAAILHLWVWIPPDGKRE